MSDDFVLERPDQERLKEQLKQVVEWLADDLDMVITRQTRYSFAAGKIRQGKNRETPLPFHLTAADASYDLTGTLQAWVDHVVQQRKVPWPGHLRSKMSAEWLINHIIHLSLCEDTDTVLDEVTHAVARVRRICDRPVFRRYQGSCEICEADLWSVGNSNTIICEECKTIVSREHNDNRIDAALQARAYTALELVEIVRDRMGLTIKPKTIHDMAYRKTNPIVVRGHTYDGQNLYNAGDVFSRIRSRKAA